MTSQRQLHLGMFVYGNGHHRAAWRLPGSPLLGAYDLPYLRKTIQELERAKFDFLFLGDTSYTAPNAAPSSVARLEPFTWLANLAAVTDKIGLVSTATTTYNEPFGIARRTASLDHLSGGRSAWNVVTTQDPITGANFSSEELLDSASRWERAEEFVQVVRALWDSIEDDAFPRNQTTGQFFDYAKFHPINHKGKHFSVKGPLNCARPPQGHPVLVQAGTSEEAFEFAAKYTEVFFNGVSDLEEAVAFYAQLRARLPRYGRRPDDIKIMPAAVPYVAETREEARAIYDRLNAFLGEEIDLPGLSKLLDVDLSKYPLDGPLPDISETATRRRIAGPLLRKARAENLSIRQVAQDRYAAMNGHLIMIGSVNDVADTIEQWFVERACDGMNICAPYLPAGLDLFINGVVPELQRRGLFRKEYSGRTVREHLGLAKPVNQFATVPLARAG